jgi:predicted alpha/beta superfamily hydrolase
MTAFLFLFKLVHAQDEEPVVIGEKVKMQSHILAKEMHLSIHIPDGYETSNAKYPVLYAFQTHFEQIAGAIKNLYDYRLTPQIICVQIDNYDFGYLTPTPIENRPNSGQADRFLKFFKEELFPFINLNYRVHNYRIIFSNSWGAAFIVYSMLTHPELFQTGIASIPWVNYEEQNRFIMDNAESILKKGNYHNNFLYMTMDNESILLPDLNTFIGILKNNPKPGLEWEYHHWPDEDHTSTPYRSIYSGLRAPFKDWYQTPDEVANKGLDEIKVYELTLNDKFGYEIGVSTSALRQAGSRLQRKNKYTEAIELFKYAIEKNPENAFGYVTLGRAYEENNQLILARESFEKGYQIAVSTSHPQVKWVKNFLDKINQKINHAK